MSLKYRVNISKDVRELAKDIKEDYKLTDFVSLSLTLNAERNELLKLGFVISSSDNHPSGLEAIAIGVAFQK